MDEFSRLFLESFQAFIEPDYYVSVGRADRLIIRNPDSYRHIVTLPYRWHETESLWYSNTTHFMDEVNALYSLMIESGLLHNTSSNIIQLNQTMTRFVHRYSLRHLSSYSKRIYRAAKKQFPWMNWILTSGEVSNTPYRAVALYSYRGVYHFYDPVLHFPEFDVDWSEDFDASANNHSVSSSMPNRIPSRIPETLDKLSHFLIEVETRSKMEDILRSKRIVNPAFASLFI